MNEGCNLAVWAARRDPFMTHGAENRGQKWSCRAFRRLLQTFSGCADRLPDLRFRAGRVTGIEPAWPVWKAGALPLSYPRELCGAQPSRAIAAAGTAPRLAPATGCGAAW